MRRCFSTGFPVCERIYYPNLSHKGKKKVAKKNGVPAKLSGVWRKHISARAFTSDRRIGFVLSFYL
jgi:hypothetical protein